MRKIKTIILSILFFSLITSSLVLLSSCKGDKNPHSEPDYCEVTQGGMECD